MVFAIILVVGVGVGVMAEVKAKLDFCADKEDNQTYKNDNWWQDHKPYVINCTLEKQPTNLTSNG